MTLYGVLRRHMYIFTRRYQLSIHVNECTYVFLCCTDYDIMYVCMYAGNFDHATLLLIHTRIGIFCYNDHCPQHAAKFWPVKQYTDNLCAVGSCINYSSITYIHYKLLLAVL